MKSKIIFTVLLSISLIANTQAQDKKRLKIIEKSIKNNSYELYKDTVFHSGVAKYLLKKTEKKSIFVSTKLDYKNLYDLSGNLLSQINLYYGSISSVAKSTSFVFWIKFKDSEDDVRFNYNESNKQSSLVKYYSMQETNDELALVKYLAENDIISEKGLNKPKVAEFIFENKESKFVCNIRNECSTSHNVKVVVKNKNGDTVDQLAPTSTAENIAVAKGDKLYLYVDTNVYAETEITSKTEKITISASCASFVKQ